ncbi:MAG: tetratricopeptide repeat protein [Candidatus Thorarchaeota archaeon]
MDQSVQALIADAEESLAKGEFKIALSFLESAKSRHDVSDEDRIACGIFETRLRIRMGEHEIALEIANLIHESAKDIANPFLIAEVLISKIELAWRIGKLDDSTRLAAELKTHLEQLKPQNDEEEKWLKKKRGDLLQNQGVLYWYQGEYEKALEVLLESLTIRKQIDSKSDLIASFNNLGLVNWSKGNLKVAMDYYNQSLEISEAMGYLVVKGNILNNLGNLYSKLGEFDKALEYLHRSLEVKEPLENKHEVATTLLNIGVVFQLRGELDKALEIYQKCLNLSTESGLKYDLALANGNLAEIYGLRGDLDEAETYYQRALEIFEEMAAKPEIARILGNLGWIFRKQDLSQRAADYFERCLKISMEVGDEGLIAASLFELVDFLTDIGNIESAKHHIEHLKKISESSENPLITQKYHVATARILKASKRARDQLRASEMLEDFLEGEIQDHSLAVSAMIHLCDLLIAELRMTGDEETFQKVKELTARLLDIGLEQSSYSLLAKTYLMQSKVALVDFDVESARELLGKAKRITIEKGLHSLARAVEYEENHLAIQLQKWESILDLHPSKREMIDFTNLTSYIDRMIKRSVSSLATEKEVLRKYKIVHLDLLKENQQHEVSSFRVGLAQIGLSTNGDILSEFYEEMESGLFKIRDDKVEAIKQLVHTMMEEANKAGVHILFFPELTIDFNHDSILTTLSELANCYGMVLVPGSFHSSISRSNVCRVIGPDGVLWEQKKHIPAVIHFEGNKIEEGIDIESQPREIIVANTKYGRIAIAICRDFLDMDLRVELKNSDPPVDLIFNPAFTPVTADFRAAHFDARRSIYAYCFFANVAEFGDSLIYSPEKDRIERTLPKGEEGLLCKEVDLFQLRAERKRWELEQKRDRSFIQSTRL